MGEGGVNKKSLEKASILEMKNVMTNGWAGGGVSVPVSRNVTKVKGVKIG
jgi:hypothetical protein